MFVCDLNRINLHKSNFEYPVIIITLIIICHLLNRKKKKDKNVCACVWQTSDHDNRRIFCHMKFSFIFKCHPSWESSWSWLSNLKIIGWLEEKFKLLSRVCQKKNQSMCVCVCLYFQMSNILNKHSFPLVSNVLSFFRCFRYLKNYIHTKWNVYANVINVW